MADRLAMPKAKQAIVWRGRPSSLLAHAKEERVYQRLLFGMQLTECDATPT